MITPVNYVLDGGTVTFRTDAGSKLSAALQGAAVAFEVDGAVHLQVLNYWEDMQRSNELVIAKTPHLRFPSLAVRVDGAKVVDQIRRALA